jgi:nucleotide-binding universal stress UspA family protein
VFRHILIATDGSEASLRAAAHAARIAKTFGSKVTMVNVEPSPEVPFTVSVVPISEEYVAGQLAKSADVRSSVIARTGRAFDELGQSYSCAQASGAPGDAIVAVAEAVGADLIVVGHRGHNLLQSLFLGSTSEHVVHCAKCSVLVVR